MAVVELPKFTIPRYEMNEKKPPTRHTAAEIFKLAYPENTEKFTEWKKENPELAKLIQAKVKEEEPFFERDMAAWREKFPERAAENDRKEREREQKKAEAKKTAETDGESPPTNTKKAATTKKSSGGADAGSGDAPAPKKSKTITEKDITEPGVSVHETVADKKKNGNLTNAELERFIAKRLEQVNVHFGEVGAHFREIKKMQELILSKVGGAVE